MEEMNVGIELDALIAEKVMGFKRLPAGTYTKVFNGVSTGIPSTVECFTKDGVFAFHVPPSYSTDIAAAWEVVDRVRIKIPQFSVSIDDKPGELRVYCIRFGDYFAYADTAPHAICLAALKAVGNE